MNITLFGGTGKTGLLVLEKALAAGYKVVVYARNPAKITIQHTNLTIIKGELTESDKIDDAVKGANTVISLLGSTGVSPELPISNGTKNIISAMQKNNVRRLVAAVSSSYRDAKDKLQFWMDFSVLILKVVGKSILKDIEEAGRLIAASQLDWKVIIRLPKLRNNSAKNGLVPHWSKDDSFASKLINARAETIAEKPSFRDAFKHTRCIIPATGFYEWDKKGKGAKQPYYFYLKDKEVFGFAGIWSEWTDEESGEVIETCTIITTEANKVLDPIHDRMPVILKEKDYDDWLDEKENNTDYLQKLLVPFPASKMKSHLVSRLVNSPGENSPDLILYSK